MTLFEPFDHFFAVFNADKDRGVRKEEKFEVFSEISALESARGSKMTKSRHRSPIIRRKV